MILKGICRKLDFVEGKLVILDEPVYKFFLPEQSIKTKPIYDGHNISFISSESQYDDHYREHKRIYTYSFLNTFESEILYNIEKYKSNFREKTLEDKFKIMMADIYNQVTGTYNVARVTRFDSRINN